MRSVLHLTDDEGKVWEMSLAGVDVNGELVTWRLVELTEGRPGAYAYITETPIRHAERTTPAPAG